LDQKRTSKLQEKPSALKMTSTQYEYFFLLLGPSTFMHTWIRIRIKVLIELSFIKVLIELSLMTEISSMYVYDESLDGSTVLFVSQLPLYFLCSTIRKSWVFSEICEELRASTPIFVIFLSVYVCKCHTNDATCPTLLWFVHINPALISCLAPAQKLFVYWGMCGLNAYTSCLGMTGWV
jgi:hypothetical protein